MPKEQSRTSVNGPGVTATQTRHNAYARPYNVSTGVNNTCSPDTCENALFLAGNGEFISHGAGHAVVFHSPTECLLSFHHLTAVIVHNRAGGLTLIFLRTTIRFRQRVRAVTLSSDRVPYPAGHVHPSEAPSFLVRLCRR